MIFQRWAVLAGIILAGCQGTREGESPRVVAVETQGAGAATSKALPRQLGPLRIDGAVDYVAAINAHYSQGITPENNALTPLLKISGTWLKKVTDAKGESVDFVVGPPWAVGEEARCYVRWSGYSGDWTKDSAEEQNRFWSRTEKPWRDDPVIEGWIKANDRTCVLLKEASQRERLFIPLIRKSPRELLAFTSCGLDLGSVQSAMDALRARAMMRAGRRDAEGAWDDLKTIVLLGAKMEQSNIFIVYLIGCGKEIGAGKRVIEMLREQNVPAEVLRDMLRCWNELPPIATLLEAFARGERYQDNDLIQDFARDFFLADAQARADLNPAEAELVTKEAAVLDLARAQKIATEAADVYCLDPVRLTPEQRKERRKFLDAVNERMEQASTDMRPSEKNGWQNNPVVFIPHQGDTTQSFTERFAYAAMSLMPGVNTDIQGYERSWRWRAATRLVLALAVHRAEKGAYPETLENLSSYFKEFPAATEGWVAQYQRVGAGYKLAMKPTESTLAERNIPPSQHVVVEMEK